MFFVLIQPVVKGNMRREITSVVGTDPPVGSSLRNRLPGNHSIHLVKIALLWL